MNQAQPAARRRLLRFSLLGLLLAFIPLAVGLALDGHSRRQTTQAINAFQAICDKGVDANFRDQDAVVIDFKNSNVTDDDLHAFVPAFNGYLPSPGDKIARLRLNGSSVSPDAVQRFQQAVPDCRIDQ